MIHALVPLFIPSPPTGIWYVFGFPLRAYALCIIAGIIVGMVIATRRWVARGGTSESLEMCVVVAVPAGIIGARLYHVITDYELYFGPDAPMTPIDALKIWHGGLGIWGAVALGVLGAYLVARRRKLAFPALLDAAAPGIAVAQGIGRLGNWFNQELFGRPTTLPWGLEISPNYRPLGYEQYATFHPTFLYELVWCLLIALALVLLDRKFRLGHGKVFALYVVFYTLGRFWIEALRIDTVNRVGGFRLNNYTSLIVFVIALVWFLWLVKNRPGREEVVEPQPAPAPTASSEADGPQRSDGEGTGGTEGTEGTGSAGEEKRENEGTESIEGAVDTSGTANRRHEPDESGHSDERTGQPRVDDTENSGPAR